MSLHESLTSFLNSIQDREFVAKLGGKGGYLTFSNSGIRGSVKEFTISLEAFLVGFTDIKNNLDKFSTHQRYVESEWRDLGSYFKDLTLKSIIQVQTKPTFSTMSKIVAWANDKGHEAFNDSLIDINATSIDRTIERLTRLVDCYSPKIGMVIPKLSSSGVNCLPKPFLLLAGISGSGKTRFVREQAAMHRNGNLTNHCLIAVRPDWHEPSDLLGYISRIGNDGDGARYVVTDLLRFVVQAWIDAKATASATDLISKPSSEMTPYWLCLDEMNLAPVEQYLADYLAILETRKWSDGHYSCEPLLKAATIRQMNADGQNEMRKQLELGADDDDLWLYFSTVGIPLPPNLIVAGTVNMDETTHGFSRKVIDRAFTIDFGEFYPNDFGEFFGEDKTSFPKTLGFPLLTGVTKDDLAAVPADAGGTKSIAFLGAINTVLKTTPFELAYRALNELLLAVVCFQPQDDAELQAVWDDFLMSKVLPRIDGDAEKLGADAESSLLTQLLGEIEKQFTLIGNAPRPDLLREKKDVSACMVECRAKQKLVWMQKRLHMNGFATFWP